MAFSPDGNTLAVGSGTGRSGVLITRVPLPQKTPSNAPVNLPSRSRMMNLNRPSSPSGKRA